jgi:hypothetical protein
MAVQTRRAFLANAGSGLFALLLGSAGCGRSSRFLFIPRILSRPTGLVFPSNGDAPSGAFVAFQFLNPHLDGLPVWGPGGTGATYIWKIRPRQQTGYYSTFWWSNNGTFLNPYYGAHPYPRQPDLTAHDWELAQNNTDQIITLAGAPQQVVNDVWYTQALRVRRNADGTKSLRFWIRLPSVADSDIIEVTLPAGYGETNPPSPALTFGDSPWYADFGHERLSGILRGIKIFNRYLSHADLLAEAGSDDLATAAGRGSVWWKKINPTPDDLLCEAGTGRNPAWAQATKAGLWVG